MCGQEEAMTNLRRCFKRGMKHLLAKVVVRPGTKERSGFAQRVPVRFNRSLSRRCFSSRYPEPAPFPYDNAD